MTATQVVRAEGGFAYGTVGADIHVFGDGVPLYLLETWQPAPPADPEFLRELPSRMLNARFAVVGFTGRERETAELHEWCTQGPRRATRLLHGPGGQGKTRLAERLARQCRDAGWKVATATLGPGSVLPPPGSQDLGTDGATGLLLLVDYADRWPLSHLTWLFSNALLHRDALPVRVLLIARSADTWPALRGVLANEQIGTSTQRLAELSGVSGARARMFTAARDSFAARYSVVDPGVIEPPESLDDPGLGLTLAVHMAALVAVDAHRRGVRAPADPIGLTVYLLDREQAHWIRRHGDHRRDLLHRSVFTAAITGPLARAEAAAALDTLRLPVASGEVLTEHAACYPAADPDRDTVLEPLYPDRLAEDFVALTLPGHRHDYPAQPWAGAALRPLLAQVRGRRALALLTAAAERWPHVGAGHLYPLLRDDPRLAVEAGSPVLTALAHLPDLDEDLIDDLTAVLPATPPADLELGAAALGVRRSREILARPGDPAAQARTRVNLANDLDRLARPEEALDAARQAVATWRELLDGATGTGRAPYEQYLAQALTNLSSLLQRVRRPADALAALLEAVAINRARHDDNRHDLALSLSNLGSLYTATGQYAHATDALAESLPLYRTLVRTDPGHEYGLAITLTNLGSTLSRAGRPAEALDPARQAVRIWRRLAEADPDAHESFLALSLSNLTSLLRDTDGDADRLPVIEEVVAIQRRLAGANPTAYREGYAVALGLLTGALERPGQRPRALETAREAAAVRREMARDEPTAGAIIRLAEALRTLGRIAAAAGRPGEAAAADREAQAEEKTWQDWVRRVGLTHHMAPPEVVERAVNRAEVTERLPPPEDLTEDPLPWRSARDIARTGRDLARSARWPQLWTLTRAVPPADACGLARLLPLDRWKPPGGPPAYALARRLAGTDPGRVTRLAAAARRPARVAPFSLSFAGQLSFAPDGSAVARHAFLHPDPANTSITVYDLGAGGETQVFRGRADHHSIACTGPGSVVAVRSGPRGALMWYHHGRADDLLPGVPADGAATVATADGIVAGLGTAPVAYAGTPDRLHQVDLSSLGLWRAGLLAADPAGTRVAISDGTVVAITDAGLRQGHGAMEVPAALGDVAGMVFVSADELLVAGALGGVLLCVLDPGGLRPISMVGTPRLTDLFSVPAWRAAGGSEDATGDAYFLDNRTLLRMPQPPALGFNRAFTASPDGRYAVHDGHPPRSRSLRPPPFRTYLHDLHQPAAWLSRPLGSVTAAELPALDRVLPGSGELRPLLELVRDLVRLAR
ncbi:tetratricopeptide repeat protein [Actinoplanes sp. NPDC051494]|uniref:tetratricopeptide repeat protein n=1 Tax=Actinoplanes sp. NPDC051494 TaxID=3363907 RepID=UPI0037A5DD1F